MADRIGRIIADATPEQCANGAFKPGEQVNIMSTRADASGVFWHTVHNDYPGKIGGSTMAAVKHWVVEEPHEFECEDPEHEGDRRIVHWSTLTTGYGTDAAGKKHCFACCGKSDLKEMRQKGQLTGYLTKKGYKMDFSNWPGTLKIHCFYSKKGLHRADAWFSFEGYVWHVVNRGDADIATAKRTRRKAQ